MNAWKQAPILVLAGAVCVVLAGAPSFAHHASPRVSVTCRANPTHADTFHFTVHVEDLRGKWRSLELRAPGSSVFLPMVGAKVVVGERTIGFYERWDARYEANRIVVTAPPSDRSAGFDDGTYSFSLRFRSSAPPALVRWALSDSTPDGTARKGAKTLAKGAGLSLPVVDLSINGGKPLRLPIGSSTQIPLHTSLGNVSFVLHTLSASSPASGAARRLSARGGSEPVSPTWGLAYAFPPHSITFRLDPAGLAPKVKRRAAQIAVRALRYRAKRAGLKGLTLYALPPDRVVVHCPAGKEKEVRRVLLRTDSLQFRILAPSNFAESESRRKRDLGADYPGPPRGFRWLPYYRRQGAKSRDMPVRRSMLVEIPEAKALATVKQLEKQKAKPSGSAKAMTAITVDLRAARRTLQKIERSEVFTEADLDPAHLGVKPDPTGPGYIVTFRMRRDRIVGFCDFTSKNLNRQLAIVFDGEVLSAPQISSPLPGVGRISEGDFGLSKGEAEVLAATLEASSFHLHVARAKTIGLGSYAGSFGADGSPRSPPRIYVPNDPSLVGKSFYMVLVATGSKGSVLAKSAPVEATLTAH